MRFIEGGAIIPALEIAEEQLFTLSSLVRLAVNGQGVLELNASTLLHNSIVIRTITSKFLDLFLFILDYKLVH